MEEPLVKNAADERQLKEADKHLKHRRLIEIEDLKFILKTEQGRRLLYRYLCECGVYRTSFTGNSTTFYNEGMRNIGLKLLADIEEAMPEAYLLMIKEKGEIQNG